MGIVAVEIYGFLESERLLPEKQIWCRRKSKGIEDQLHIDMVLFQEVKQRKKNLKKEKEWWDGSIIGKLDLVPHSWVIESLNMIGITKNVVNVFGKNDEILEGGANL